MSAWGGDEARPVAGAELDAWVRGLPDEDAAVAVVAAGLDTAEWLGWLDEPAPRYLTWRLRRDRLGRPPRDVIAEVGAEPVRRRPWEGAPGWWGVRLLLEGDPPVDVVARLLRAPGVGSVVLPATRPSDAGRREPWQWPLRVGLLGLDADAVAAATRLADPDVPHDGDLPDSLLDIRDLTAEPGFVDVLVAPFLEAAEAVRTDAPAANAVVLLAAPSATGGPLDVLRTVRALTGAVVGAVGLPGAAPDGTARTLSDDAGRLLHRLVRGMSWGEWFDVAVTAALGRTGVIELEPEAVARLDLSFLVGGAAGRGGGDEPPETEPPPEAAPPPPTAPPEEPVTAGAEPPEPTDEPHAEPHAEPDPRWLQCEVNGAATSAGRPAHTLVEGTNTVDVFIGPPEEDALRGAALTNEALGFTPGVLAVRLTVVLVPLVPRGAPQRTELDVAPTGRSPDARLLLEVPPGTEQVAARILLLHRNRLLQTAVLTGVVGAAAELRDYALVRPDLADLDDRAAFDAAIVSNHDAAGRPAVIAHHDGSTAMVEVEVLQEIEAIVGRMRAHLVEAAFLKPSRGKALSKAARTLLVRLAVEGRDLHGFLEEFLLPFGADARRFQIVTSRTGLFLPLELAYTRIAPDDDAALCASWLDGGTACGPSCGAGPDDTSIVCPAAFLGMSSTVERHYLDPTESQGGRQFLTTAQPVGRRRRLRVTHALVGASTKVPARAVTGMLGALDPGARRVATWEEWVAALADAPSDLLVLLPHTDVAAATLEISKATLHRGRIEARHVTGGHDGQPIVLLFGCDTAGSSDDPAGFATRFLSRRAAVVLSSLTMLLASHAALLAQHVAERLRDPDRPEQPLGELITAFRQAAVRDGVLAGLSITAYGDADWTV